LPGAAFASILKNMLMLRIVAALLLAFHGSTSWAVIVDEEPDEGPFVRKPLDNVQIEALETYANPKRNELGIGGLIYPFSSYYNAFGVNGGFTHYFTDSFAWEVVNGTLYYTVLKDLTTELAENFNSAPQQIVYVKHNISTNLVYVLSYGKLLVFNRLIRSFRASLIGGVGALGTSLTSQIAANVGLRSDFYITSVYSWRVEIRDAIAFKNSAAPETRNYVTFMIGTSFGF
jgi:outer membrane beta-barrel protein